MDRRLGRLILFSPLILAAFVGFVAIGGLIVRELWNWLLPSMFGWPRLTFWKALGLLALCRILFGGLGLSPSPRARMTPEERERFRRRMRERFGFGSSGGPAESAGPSAS